MKNLRLYAAAAVLLATTAGCSSTHGEGHGDRASYRMEKKQEKATLEVAQAFLTAAGSGDADTLRALMTDDFVWHNEGDKTLPWIGPWRGPDEVFTKFMPAFGPNFKTTSWTTDYTFVEGEEAVFMGSMSATLTTTGAETGTFSWAVRVEVSDGKVKSWNWFEDSFSVSNAYHGR